MAIPLALVAEGALKGIGKLTGAMDRLTGIFTRSMAFADDSQKASLALGTTYQRVSKEFVGTVQGLRGDIHTKFAGAFKAMEAGLQGNSAGVAKLINQQMLTGTQYARTATAFAALQDIAGVQTDGMNRLASSFVETGNKYGVATDVLVNALNSLAESFPAARLAGLGSQFFGAVTQLQAELGPAMAGPLNSVMSMVMDTSLNGYQKLVTLGIGGVREQLMAAQSTADQVAIIKNAMIIAGDRFASVAGDVKTGYFKLGVATDVFGKEAMMMRIIQQQFADNARDTNKQTVDYAKQLSVLGKEVITPIIEVLSEEFYPKVLEAADLFSAVGKQVSEAFSEWIDQLPLGEEAFRDFLRSALVNTRSILNTVGSAAGGLVNVIKTKIIPTLNDFFHVLRRWMPDVFVDRKDKMLRDQMVWAWQRPGPNPGDKVPVFGDPHFFRSLFGIETDRASPFIRTVLEEFRRKGAATILSPEQVAAITAVKADPGGEVWQKRPLRGPIVGTVAHNIVSAHQDLMVALRGRLTARQETFGADPENIANVTREFMRLPGFSLEAMIQAAESTFGAPGEPLFFDFKQMTDLINNMETFDNLIDIQRRRLGLPDLADIGKGRAGFGSTIINPFLERFDRMEPIWRESARAAEQTEINTRTGITDFMSESVMGLGSAVDTMLGGGGGVGGVTLEDVVEALSTGNVLSDRMARGIETGGYVVPATSRD